MNGKKTKIYSEAPADEKIAAFTKFLESQNAAELAVIELTAANAFTEAIMVAGASSRRHAQGLADGIARICHEKNYEFLGMEGFDAADWILVDCNDVVVNIFQEETRQLYKLEELWSRLSRSPKKEI